MARHTVRLMHRIAVDWVADTFGLRTPGARARHENARDRAGLRAARLHERARAAAQANAAALPARLHAERGEPRVLTAWQTRIGNLASWDGAKRGADSRGVDLRGADSGGADSRVRIHGCGFTGQPEPGATVLVLGATGVTGRMAVQAAPRADRGTAQRPDGPAGQRRGPH